MFRNNIDELYHQLRLVSVDGTKEEKRIIKGLANHLLSEGGDYNGLLDFLTAYGKQYILAPVHKSIQTSYGDTSRFTRVVDIGAGIGWLGEGLSKLMKCDSLLVDKRRWDNTDIVCDLENIEELGALTRNTLCRDDILVMCEFLHCTDNPIQILNTLRAWPIVIIEYKGNSIPQQDSYKAQISKYGCKPVLDRIVSEMASSGRLIHHNFIGPYTVLILNSMRW